MTHNGTRFEGFIPKRTTVPARSLRRSTGSVKIGEPSTRLPPRPQAREILDPEMAERERAALKEIERKKLCTGVAYNKGAYQYISNKDDALTLGR